MKKTFASKTFASKSFASGNWTGVGVAAAEITPAFHTIRGAHNNNASLRNTSNLSSSLLGAQNNNASLRGNEG